MGLFIEIFCKNSIYGKPLDSRYILPRFGEVRAKCGKKCFKGEPCHICELIQESSGLLEEAGLVIEKEKK